MRSTTGHGQIEAWKRFVLQHGWRARASDLSAVLGQDESAILAVRRMGACTRLQAPKAFAELFSLWHGRAPADADWPAPRRLGSRREYEWQVPELVLLASLVGQIGPADIAQTLTARLQQRTGDPTATRSRHSVLVMMQRVGLQTSDVVGGLTVSQAGREIGSVHVVQQAIAAGTLSARRSGRLWVIPHQAWAEFKAKRTFPPRGYVPLASLKEPLAIKSDKLSEFARMGYIPTAVQCNPFGTGRNTQFGTWYVSAQTARKLKADRKAGHAMPWHGKPNPDNLKTTFRLWQKRQHPKDCPTCTAIWRKQGAPATFEDYCLRYPPLAHGAKRHLTMPWSPGLTLDEVARKAGRPRGDVLKALANGMLEATNVKGRKFVPRAEATRWIARRCPDGEGAKSWVSLQTACKQYRFTLQELRDLITRGELASKTGTEGAMRGIVYVRRIDCRRWRDKQGFTDKEAARRLGVTPQRLRGLLSGVDWRDAQNIPLETLQAMEKRLRSRHGWDLKEAAAELGKSVKWVEERLAEGVARVSRAPWDRRRRYLSAPMMERLRAALKAPKRPPRLPASALSLAAAALDAGVSTTTLLRWVEAGEVDRIETTRGWAYPRRSVRARARRYWSAVRFERATPPAWLAKNTEAAR